MLLGSAFHDSFLKNGGDLGFPCTKSVLQTTRRTRSRPKQAKNGSAEFGRRELLLRRPPGGLLCRRLYLLHLRPGFCAPALRQDRRRRRDHQRRGEEAASWANNILSNDEYLCRRLRGLRRI